MKRLFENATVLLLVLSVALNVGLAYKIRGLTSTKTPQELQVGTHIDSLSAQDLAGKPVEIHFAAADEPTVLYVFSPTCRWCAKNLDNVKKLYSEEHSRFHFVGVSLAPDGVPEYIAESGFPLNTVKNPATAAVKTLHLAGTPETILIDAGGDVRAVWAGAYRSDICRDMESYFKLPAETLKGI